MGNSILDITNNDERATLEVFHTAGINRDHFFAVRKAKGDDLLEIVKAFNDLRARVLFSIDCGVNEEAPQKHFIVRPEDRIMSAVREKIIWNREAQAGALYRAPCQVNIGVSGLQIAMELEGKKVLPWSVGRWLLDWDRGRQQLDIPMEWRRKKVFFWGTIFYDSHPIVCKKYVTYIDFLGGRFGCGQCRVDSLFGPECFAAVLTE